MLHPHFGLPWFKRLDSDRAAYAKTLFEHVFDNYAKKRTATAPVTVTAPRASTGSNFLDDVCMLDVADVEEPDEVVVKPEYERFYSGEKTHGKGDFHGLLAWWKASMDYCLIFPDADSSFGTNERDFPVIAAMARDFLAIPGTSVSVERLFSTARQLCQDMRSSLAAEMIMEAMLTRAWLRADCTSSHRVIFYVISIRF